MYAGCYQTGTSFSFDCVVLSNPQACQHVVDPNPLFVKTTKESNTYDCPEYSCEESDLVTSTLPSITEVRVSVYFFLFIIFKLRPPCFQTTLATTETLEITETTTPPPILVEDEYGILVSLLKLKVFRFTYTY